MRLRNIKGADEAVAESIYCIQNPRDYRGNWHTLFPIQILSTWKSAWEKENLLWN